MSFAKTNIAPIKKTTGSILVYSQTNGFRHGSIAAGITMLRSVAEENSWEIQFSEDSNQFTESNLSQFNAVIWLNTTGDILNTNQQLAFESYIENGGGYLGIHSAADTEYDWPWYGTLVGAYFDSHPAIQNATINVENTAHKSTAHLDDTWLHNDEWYNYRTNPRSSVEVLLSLDESSYSPGSGAMGDHPIAWKHSVGQGRSFYSGLGHTDQAYSSADFRRFIQGALSWAGHLDVAGPEWMGAAPADSDFSTTALATGINEPMALEISEDNEFYVIGRRGEFYALENELLNVKSTIATNSDFEGGLIGFALDPNFTENRRAYFHYTHSTLARLRVTQMSINDDNTLDFSSEIELLNYPTDYQCCHVAGDMEFDSEGNLYIATGDNTNPFQSEGYAPIDEGAGRSLYDAQRTAANTNDLRGKILRIKPLANGTYTIPEGNLFDIDAEHRTEIYTMGHRNPFRIAIDPSSDRLFWGEVGPDSNSANSQRGPAGVDEINRTLRAGNFGWPYFTGENTSYTDYDFQSRVSSGTFNANNVQNNSVNNTGATSLPDAQGSWLYFPHRAIMLSDVYRWDASIEDPFKLPSYFDGHLLYWNFNNDSMFEVAVDGDSSEIRPWLDTSLLNGIIDAEISPYNNRLYILAYGGNCCGAPPFAGMLAETRYIGDGGGEPVIDDPDLGVGDTVSLNLHGGFLNANATGEVRLNTVDVGNDDIFEIITAADNSIALQSISSGLYLSATNGGVDALSASATTIGVDEQFELSENTDGSYALRSRANCNYVSASSVFTESLIANAETASINELFQLSAAQRCEPSEGYGIACRPGASAYLNMPSTTNAELLNVPALLSQTGAFSDVATLSPSASLIPFDLVSPLWSDRAQKQRWVSIPSDKQITWTEEGKWQWPEGTIFVKHFELPIDESNSDLVKRLETRITVMQSGNTMYGATYKWRDDNSEADLLFESLDEPINVASPSGDRQQTWTYPSPMDCMTCHNQESTGVLGPKTASLNKSWLYPSSISDNQLRTLNHLGVFSIPFDESAIAGFPAHAHIGDTSASLELRLRSYWDVNCANCHGPQGIAAQWDARIETPLGSQGIIDGPVAGQRDYLNDYGLSDPVIVAPGDIGNSVLYIRDKSVDPQDRMPPLGRSLEDEVYMNALETWINSLP
ncbi:MAG: putative repeat protein (TIGR03806 family) [Flavobacteriales bacterium]